MSSADLYEDGFPHGTAEGYNRGCRGSACPAGIEHGTTCAQAKQRYNGDYQYRKRVDAGLTPDEIHAAELADAAAAQPAKPKPVARKKPEPPTPVDPALSQWPDDGAQPADPTPTETDEAWTVAIDEKTHAAAVGYDYTDPRTGKPIPLDEHGTPAGYRHGCRDINCPGVRLVGKSCRKAISDYNTAKKLERREEARARHAARVAARQTTATELAADELVKVEAFGLDHPEPEQDAFATVAAAQLADWERELLGMAEAASIANAAATFDADLNGEPIEDTLRRALWESEARNRELVAQLRDAETSRAVDAQRVVVPAGDGRTVTITVVIGG